MQKRARDGSKADAGMPMDENGSMNMHPENFLQEIVHHGTSGTSAEPNSTPVPMLMTKKANWVLMFHANASFWMSSKVGKEDRTNFFSTNWFMAWPTQTRTRISPRG